MVSKVAVIAIVAILAVPILLGYAFNLEQTTETDYKVSGDPINVTQLLQNGTYYTPVKADVYQLNNRQSMEFNNVFYENVGDIKTTYHINAGAGEHEQSGWVDFSSGFHFYSNNNFDYNGRINFNSDPKNILITINLDSLEDEENSFFMYSGGSISDSLIFNKETIDGDVKWSITSPLYDQEETDIYYDNSINDNTYQIYITYTDPILRNDVKIYNVSYYIRYVGHWPSFIGSAYSYMEYKIETESHTQSDISYFTIRPHNALSGVPELRSPTLRVDSATFNGMEYQTIQDKTYKPGDFKNNPSTRINEINLYGSSLEFGGITYTVSKEGKITVNSHEIPLNNLVFSSVPNDDFGYDNRIGNTVISNTANVSTIKFNGMWSATISTESLEEYDITKTEWKAGDFAWDGMDQNFIMAGLLASLGAFVGVGIYARRTKATVWPLMIVCGGAALLFFTML